MTTILCPTRGGEASQPNQEKAISLARERQAHLIFMYVYNVQFLRRISSPVLADLEDEMDDLGEFLLAIAQDRAEEAGLHADALVRQGIFRHALKDVIQEYAVDTIVIGSASGPKGYTDDKFIQELVGYLQSATGVEVIVLHNGEVMGEYPASKVDPA